MSWKTTLILGGISTALSAAACLLYAYIYSASFLVDFSMVAGPMNLVVASAFGCLLMAVGYKVAIQWKGRKMQGWLNVLYAVLSFASIAGVFGFNLPLDVAAPEMFPGLVIPMHFFPLLSLLVVVPFFEFEKA